MKKKYYLLFGILGLIIAMAVAMPYWVNAKAEENELIPQGVYAGEISLGGMTEEEAVQAIEETVTGLQSKKVTLEVGNNKVETTAGSLGLSWGNPEIVGEAFGIGVKGNLLVRYKELKDLEHEGKVLDIVYAVDKKLIAKLLEENEATLNTEAVDAELEKKNDSFVTTPEVRGIAIDIEESANKIEAFFRKEWEGNDTMVELAADIVEPKATQEELEKVKDVLGSFQTNYGTSNAARRQNVENGTAKINGAVIYPGEEFSVYDVTSPFELDNGYAVGTAYENGQVVDSIGGGICQVSTTLYNAAIRAELEITERYPHSMTVTYVKPSEDAAIAGTYKNLRFVNNTEAPIYIEGYTADSMVGFNIYGQETRPGNRSVTFESEILTTTQPGVQYRAVSEEEIGYMSTEQGEHVGYTARLWKIVTVDGVEQERKVFNTSTYRPSDKVVLVGVGSANPDAVAAVSAAVATQDEGTIQVAIAQWNDAAMQAAAEQAAAEQAAAEQEAELQEPQEPQDPQGTEPQEPQETKAPQNEKSKKKPKETKE